MSHSVGITLIANQSITLLDKKINIHMLSTIAVDSDGRITSFCIKDSRVKTGYVWVEKGDDYNPQDINDYVHVEVVEKSKVSNLTYLSETMGGNKVLIQEIIDVFLKQAPKENSNLTEAIRSGNYHDIKNIAHAMKSSANIMGITTMNRVLQEIEELAKTKSDMAKILQLKIQANLICKEAIEEITIARKEYI